MRHGKAHMQATTVSTLSLLELLFQKMAQTTQLFSSEMPEMETQLAIKRLFFYPQEAASH